MRARAAPRREVLWRSGVRGSLGAGDTKPLELVSKTAGAPPANLRQLLLPLFFFFRSQEERKKRRTPQQWGETPALPPPSPGGERALNWAPKVSRREIFDASADIMWKRPQRELVRPSARGDSESDFEATLSPTRAHERCTRGTKKSSRPIRHNAAEGAAGTARTAAARFSCCRTDRQPDHSMLLNVADK